MSYADIGDNELIYLIRSNNQESKEYLIKRYQKRIYGMINSFLAKSFMRGLDYEDFYHECFVVFLKCLERFDEEYNFFKYVEGAINKELAKLVEREKKKREVISIDYEFYDKEYLALDTVSDSSVVYREKEVEEYIKSNFDQFSIQIIEYRLRGYSYSEISRILNISKKSLYRKSKEIKEIISRKIEKYKEDI